LATADSALGLFQGFGVELEYMIARADTLDVYPIADRLLTAEAGRLVTECEHDDISWSNELALHVVELKTSGPSPTLEGLAAAFHQHVLRATGHLESLGAVLLPGAAHPWMDPERDARLWPHEYNQVYQAFNRIFDCRGHGWTNLQSAHINLPFAGAEEFGRLHAAIRLVLPLLPALAASSPVLDGRVTGMADSRLEAYRHHCDRIPSLVGGVIPEPVFDPETYHDTVLQGLYRDLGPHDPQGILQHEWVNARGAIPRFDRSTIEIRVIDVQECPQSDLAVAAATIALLRELVAERVSSGAAQRAVASAVLREALDQTIRHGERGVIADRGYLGALGLQTDTLEASQLWGRLLERLAAADPSLEPHARPLEVVLRHGTLARRLLGALGPEPSREQLTAVYRGLVDCLRSNEPFIPW